MDPVLRQGWELDDRNNSSDIVKAKLPQILMDGGNQPVEIVANIKTGNFDVYETRQIGPRPDKPMFSYNASNNKVNIIERSAYNKYYNTPEGQDQLNKLLDAARLATFDNAQLNTGTDPVRNQNFQDIKSKDGYRSIANRTQQGERAPGATPTSSLGGNPQDKPTITEVTGLERLKFDEKTNYKFAPPSGLRYPNDIGTTTQDRIKFIARKLLPRIPNTEESTFNLSYTFGERNLNDAKIPVDGPVIIAIQAPISDQNGVEWGGDNVNPLDAATFGLALNLITRGENPETVGNTIQGFVASLYNTAKGNQTRIQTYLAGQAANINNVLARTDNVLLNPNLELLFNGPQLRPFTFTFKMSARTKDEAQTIKRIINYFKYHMAARRETNELFLRAPHVFDIQYCYGGESQKHPGINEIKTCALTNFSVDYTPLGSYATYSDGTMVAYTMNMQFQELRPIYDTDYDGYQTDDLNPTKTISIGP